MKLLRHLEMIQPDGSKGRGVLHVEVDRDWLLALVREIDQSGHAQTLLCQFPSVGLVITGIPSPLDSQIDGELAQIATQSEAQFVGQSFDDA